MVQSKSPGSYSESESPSSPADAGGSDDEPTRLLCSLRYMRPEIANETREGALSGLSQIAGGAVFRGLPRLCASFDQPASTCEADPEKGPRPIHPRVGVPI